MGTIQTTAQGQTMFYLKDSEGNYYEASSDQVIARARIMASSLVEKGKPLAGPSDVKSFLWGALPRNDRESFSVTFLDVQHRVIQHEVIATGTIRQCRVHIREVVRQALVLNACAMIISHNHPSGNPNPSEDDIRFTKNLKKALENLEISLLDHMIVTDSVTVSLAEQGLV